MRNSIFPLLAALIIIISGCDTGYSVENDRVVYKKWNEGTGGSTSILEDADPSSFRDLNGIYAVDNRHAFFESNAIRGEDVKSFEALSPVYARDKHFVYYNGENILGSNPHSFKLFDIQSGHDGANLYMQGQLKPVCDIASFTRISDSWQKDTKCVYSQMDRIPNADPSTFVVLDDSWAKDKKHVYYSSGATIVDADPNTFRLDSSNGCVVCARDENHCYAYGQVEECSK